MRQYTDEYRHKGMRNKLLSLLKEKGIVDGRVLAAMNNVPRHYFMDLAFDRIAYEDRAFEIGENQTISQPYTVAYQTQLLSIQPFDKVLEIGTGSTYQSAVLAEMGANVFTIERIKKLFDRNKQFKFIQKYPSIKFFYGDGFEGLPTFAPFDKIIITAAAPEVPEKLLTQLKTGGKMVIPVNEESDKQQRMMRIEKKEDGSTTEERFDLFSFVPMLDGKVIGVAKAEVKR